MKTTLSKTLAALVFGTGLSAFFGAAQAGTIQLLVTDKDGQPVPDVVVPVESAMPTAARAAAAPLVITQESQRFVPFLSVVAVGSTLRFVNRDTYDHHVRSTPSGPLGSIPAAKNFEFRLDAVVGAPSPNDECKSPAGARKRSGVGSGASSADVKVDSAGPIGLGCHIHASMRGQVDVSGTAWFAKPDANGADMITDVPDGAAELKLWHPDQLAEQVTQRVQVSSTLLKAAAQLNFTPRRRRS